MRPWMIGLAGLWAVFVATSAAAQNPAPPGKFDSYVLSLSWSPTYCATRAGRGDDEQCGPTRPYGFVVHGLWPQYATGGYPAECVASPPPVPDAVVAAMLPIMPSQKLIRHEWSRHGTCQGANPAEYFAKTREAFAAVHIPKIFVAPQGPVIMTPAQVEAAFMAVNTGLTADGVAVVCRGHHGAEIRLCLDKDLRFTACARDVRDRCAGQALFAPAR